jgi:hypothetical protein
VLPRRETSEDADDMLVLQLTNNIKQKYMTAACLILSQHDTYAESLYGGMYMLAVEGARGALAAHQGADTLAHWLLTGA